MRTGRYFEVSQVFSTLRIQAPGQHLVADLLVKIDNGFTFFQHRKLSRTASQSSDKDESSGKFCKVHKCPEFF
ncbi:hypothetical protein D3C85_1646080 [compost metagenome]